MRHIAIIHRPYLDAILAGTKTVESRLSEQRRAPFGRVRVGDVMYFKEKGGPFRAKARVAAVVFEADLTPARVRALQRRFGEAVGAPDDYWSQRLGKRYATLVWFEGVEAVRRGPSYRDQPGYSPRSAWHIVGAGNARRRAA